MDFNEKAAPAAQISPAEYQSLLEKLVTQGKGWGKTKDVGGYLTDDINFVTQTPESQVKETKNKIEVQKVAVTIDTDFYPKEETRDLIIADVTAKWGGKLIKKRNADEPEFEGPGVWLIKRNAFLDDYMPTDKPNTYTPNPKAYRVTVTLDKPVNIPVTWNGGFLVETGGALAIRQKDVPALVEALQSIRSGASTVEDALYSVDAKSGEKLAKFDIYGMGPGFQEKNYKPVTLDASITALQTSFAGAPKRKAGGNTLG